MSAHEGGRAPDRRRRALLLGVMAAFAMLAGGGCRVTYVLRVGWGQARLLLARRSIEEVLADPATPPAVLSKLRLIQDVKGWAIEGLGLAPAGVYESYVDLGGRPVSWNLTAAPVDRLEPVTWWFPVVGRIPYLGFFDASAARAEEGRLRRRGLDTYLRPVSAYSTLGWFADPVTSAMIAYPEEALVELVVHEMTHGTIYVPGRMDFNESLASFVGREAAVLWYTEREGEGAAAVRRIRAGVEADRRMEGLLDETWTTLARLYAEGGEREDLLARREEVFEGLRARHREVFPDEAGGWILDGPLDNAVLVAHRVYHTETGLFERFHARHGDHLPATVAALRGLAAGGDPWAVLRREAGGEGEAGEPDRRP